MLKLKQRMEEKLKLKPIIYGIGCALPWAMIGARQTYDTGDWNYMLEFGTLAIVIGSTVALVASFDQSL